MLEVKVPRGPAAHTRYIMDKDKPRTIPAAALPQLVREGLPRLPEGGAKSCVISERDTRLERNPV